MSSKRDVCRHQSSSCYRD
ncbi:hypothetical protein LINPERPRIM_LOCUS10239 [Linum perenne]